MSPLTPLGRRRLLRTGALGAFAVAGSALYVLSLERPTLLEELPPPDRVGAHVPTFSIEGLSSGDLRQAGHPVLLNFFASWCAPCVQEAPLLLQARDAGLPVWGIAFKDRPDATQAFLAERGDPYRRLAWDPRGTVADLFGLVGVPTSLLVDREGIIRWQATGGLNERTLKEALLPTWRRLA